MNILYLLTHSLEVGGAQKDIFAFTKELVKRGHNVVVTCRDRKFAQNITSLGGKYYSVDFHFNSLKKLRESANSLKNIIEKEKIDIIAPQSIRTTLAVLFANSAKKPVITTIHNIHSKFSLFISGIILNLASRLVIFESEYERNRLIRWGLSQNKTIVVHSGIDLNRFSPREKDKELLRELGFSPDDIIIGTVARLSPEKGQEYIIEAMPVVLREFPRARFIFVGDGPLKDSLWSMVDGLGLKDKVVFVGLQKDIPRFLSIMDLFVLSSTRESFPQSAREAMAMGKPVIATNIGGCPEVVRDGVTGILIKPGNAGALTSAIIGLLKDKAKMHSMAEAGRKRAESLFDEKYWINANEHIMQYFVKETNAVAPKKQIRAISSNLSYVLSRQKDGVRILMYHRVSDNRPYDRLCVKVGEFRKQMEWLKEHFEVVGLKEVSSWAKKVVITFDDGYEDNYTNAFPILKEYNLPATVFVATESVGKEGFLSWDQIQQMSRNAIEFGAHTLNHVKLAGAAIEEAKLEIEGSKKIIESYGLKCDFFCYPKGDFNAEVKFLTAKAGFKVACSIKPGANLPGQDQFELKRTEVSGFDSMFDFRKKLAGSYDLLHRWVQKAHSSQPIAHSKLNVMYVIWSLGLGGAEQVVINLAKGLDKSRFNVAVCCLNQKGVFAENLEKEGIPVLELHKKGKIDLFIIRKLVRVMKSYDIDIVHTHLWGANLWGTIAAKIAGIKCITTIHNTEFADNKLEVFFEKFLAKLPNRIIAVGEEVKNAYIENAKVAADKIDVIYNGIEIKKLSVISYQSSVKRGLGIKDDEIVLAIIGRLVEQKGHKYLFEAISHLNGNYNIKLLVVGDGPIKESLWSMVDGLELKDKVIFTGFRKDIADIMDASNIIAVPSLYEGIPIVILEAMARKRPVIVTNIGGNRELIDTEESFVPVADSVSLAKAIEKFIKSPELCQVVADSAYERVRTIFSLGNMINKTQDLYIKLLDPRSPFSRGQVSRE
ncbi:MAG: glycosyltransferase [Candidatus Omnitrophota bacterium]